MYTELKQVKYTQQLQRQRINEDDWQYLKSHYTWIRRDYKKMFIKRSLWALMLGSMNLQELKYGYRMDISVGVFPSHLHICSLVYNKSWPNYHSCHLHILNIHMRGLCFASSPVKGFAAPGHTHTHTQSWWKGVFLFSLSTGEKIIFLIWAEKLPFYNICMKKCLFATVGF